MTGKVVLWPAHTLRAVSALDPGDMATEGEGGLVDRVPGAVTEGCRQGVRLLSQCLRPVEKAEAGVGVPVLEGRAA